MTELKDSPATTHPVTLLKPHTHDGRPCAKGAVINVTQPDAVFLLKREIISKADFDAVKKALPAK